MLVLDAILKVHVVRQFVQNMADIIYSVNIPVRLDYILYIETSG